MIQVSKDDPLNLDQIVKIYRVEGTDMEALKGNLKSQILMAIIVTSRISSPILTPVFATSRILALIVTPS